MKTGRRRRTSRSVATPTERPAAVAIGIAGPTALAAGEEPRTAVVAGIDDPTEEDLHAVTQEEAQEAARSVLDSDEPEVQELVQSSSPSNLRNSPTCRPSPTASPQDHPGELGEDLDGPEEDRRLRQLRQELVR
ncbi:hypothetical protein ACSNOK_27035 [Streptomyces sp. URMC 126]|uniref:hypothetical protein n=1 Tax=Streptomyces sp. URMC 126 TaxID=3423401 RepID=UPI003F1AFD6E